MSWSTTIAKRLCAVLAWALLAGLASAAVSTPSGSGGVDAQSAADEEPPERSSAWPEAPDRATLEKDVARLRKASTEEMGVDAERALSELGAAAAPELLKALGKERDEGARERILRVLERITGPAHTRLLAQEFGNRSEQVRVFVLERTAALPDPGLVEAALAALARARKGGDKTSARELRATALAVTASGSLDALDELRASATLKPGDPALRTALRGVRGPEASERVAAWLSEPDRRVRAAALEMLAGCGDASSVARVKPFLDDQDNTLRIAAINALRGIVDDEAPLDKLPVFEAIELAKLWKERL